MPLVVITINDTAEGVDVGFLSEPVIDTANPDTKLTRGQMLALMMLQAVRAEAPKQPEKGRIQLLN